MLKFKLNKIMPYIISSFMVVGYSSNSLAEEAAKDVAKGDAKESKVEVIMVTARKRNEKLQEVPEAVTVITESMIEDTGLTDLSGISAQMPNMTMNYSFRQSIIKINARGFSTPQYGDAPVAYVVDGFAVTDLDFINQGVFDVKDIQVLRGPQGSLYGRGALQGAVLINTKQPGNDAAGFAQVTYKSGNDLHLSGAFSGPVIEDKLFFRVGGYVQERDGEIENALGDDLDGTSDYAIRGMLRWWPTEDLDVTLSARVSDGEFGTAQVTVTDYDDYDNADAAAYTGVTQDYVGHNERKISEYNLKVEWDLGFASLTSLTSYSDLDDIVFADGDFSLSAAGGASGTRVQADFSERSSLSQEFRLSSEDTEDFSWMLGGLYQARDWNRVYESFGSWGDNTTIEQYFTNAGGYCNTCTPDWTPDSLTADITPERKSTGIGVFVHGAWDVTEQLELSAALRYDQDERENLDTASNLRAGFDADIKLEETFSELQPKIALAYQATDDLLVYGSAARAFRSGGFNALNFAFQPGIYEQETSDSIELGIKSAFMDERVTLNGAIFTSKAENYQRSLFDIPSDTLGIENIDEVDVKGFELELQATLTDNLHFSAAYGYVDTEIVNFKDVAGAIETAETYGALTGASQAEIDALGVAAGERATTANTENNGNVAPYIPKHTFNMSLRHEWALSNTLDLVSFISFRQVGKINWEAWGNTSDYNTPTSSPKEIVNVRFSLKSDDWSVALFANNITDERRPVDQFVWWREGNLGAVSPNKPRSYGVSVKYNF
jgi:iron complex outermembrane receptor protein